MINNIKTTIVDDYLYVWEKLNTDGIRLLHMYSKLAEKKKTAAVPAPAYAFDLLDDDAIIEL